jgi:hypothetical protein
MTKTLSVMMEKIKNKQKKQQKAEKHMSKGSRCVKNSVIASKKNEI